ncbi:MAG TPA: 2'-5' RNA ligase family protein, partial [Patescibacteria group bacterium]|nr:2'-5' RNA ligase family protein [Patescibacteria group bacterium]
IAHHPIAVKASTLEVFHTRNHGEVVVALVDDNPELQSLYTDLQIQLQSLTMTDPALESHPFKPHLSFFYQTPVSKLEEVSRYCREEFLPLTFSFSSIYLLRQVDGVKGERVKVQEFNL